MDKNMIDNYGIAYHTIVAVYDWIKLYSIQLYCMEEHINHRFKGAKIKSEKLK